MKQVCLGVLAHVDAGKTTLSEAMLYRTGSIRKMGRVDHGDAFLDTDVQERSRGITIFSKQARFAHGGTAFTLLDTPGHVDFSAETERTLQVLDAAVLVISGTDGVQGHTQTLWHLLARYDVPTFFFVNKMDLTGADRDRVLAQLQTKLHAGCIAMDREQEDLAEEVALCDDALLEAYMDGQSPTTEQLAALVGQRKLFPVFFGAALKLEGVAPLLDALAAYTPVKTWPETFGARVYKIMRDEQGNRLTCLKVTGGRLKVRTPITGEDWEEKIHQIRLYSGGKFQTVEEVAAGSVCAVTGLSHTLPGDGLGFEPRGHRPQLQPVLSYKLTLPPDWDCHKALLRLRELEEEDPQLHIHYDERLREIHLQPMGEVHMEVLQRLMAERFGMAATFGEGNIVYKETIAAPVKGAGHFEPLRHYAEVHLLLEPLPTGSGLQVESRCSQDVLSLNWQRLILTHLEEKTHLGVLTGSPITDMKISILTGRAHEKHTEGGDFRQATYRAVRHGLRKAQSVLLEPWYAFRLEVPMELIGRAITDIQNRCGSFDDPVTEGELSVLTGRAPVATLRQYGMEVIQYTRGRGRLSCLFDGYAPCHNTEEVLEKLAYDVDADTENTADSVFCSHGAGYHVPWQEADGKMHLKA